VEVCVGTIALGRPLERIPVQSNTGNGKLSLHSSMDRVGLWIKWLDLWDVGSEVGGNFWKRSE